MPQPVPDDDQASDNHNYQYSAGDFAGTDLAAERSELDLSGGNQVPAKCLAFLHAGFMHHDDGRTGKLSASG